MLLTEDPMVISMTDKKHLSSASQEKFSSYTPTKSSSNNNSSTNSSSSAKNNNLKRTISTASPSGVEDEDKRPQPKRRKSTGAEVSHGSGRKSSTSAPRPMPLSERQQLALLMQMTAAESQHNTESDTPSRLPTLQSSAHKRSVAKVDKRNERGETPLHIASKRGDVTEVKKLINAGADVNVTDYAGWTALHEACNRGHQTIARLLLTAGANVNVQGMDNDTPLHDAASSGHSKLVKLLLRHGANPTQCNKQGKSAVDVASNSDIMRLLKSEMIASASSSSESIGDARSPTSPESVTGEEDVRHASPSKAGQPVTQSKVPPVSRMPPSSSSPLHGTQALWPSSQKVDTPSGNASHSQSTLQSVSRYSSDSSHLHHLHNHLHVSPPSSHCSSVVLNKSVVSHQMVGDQSSSSPRLMLKFHRKDSSMPDEAKLTTKQSNSRSEYKSYSVTLAATKEKNETDTSPSPSGSISSDDGDVNRTSHHNIIVSSNITQQLSDKLSTHHDAFVEGAVSLSTSTVAPCDKSLNNDKSLNTRIQSKVASITKGTSGKAVPGDNEKSMSKSSESTKLSSSITVIESSSASVILPVECETVVSRSSTAGPSVQQTYSNSNSSSNTTVTKVSQITPVSSTSWLNGLSPASGSPKNQHQPIVQQSVVSYSGSSSQSIVSKCRENTSYPLIRSSASGHVTSEKSERPSALHSHNQDKYLAPTTSAGYHNGSSLLSSCSSFTPVSDNRIVNGHAAMSGAYSSSAATASCVKRRSPILAQFEDISDSEEDKSSSVKGTVKGLVKPSSLTPSVMQTTSTVATSKLLNTTSFPATSFTHISNTLKSSFAAGSRIPQTSLYNGQINGIKQSSGVTHSKSVLNGAHPYSLDNQKTSIPPRPSVAMDRLAYAPRSDFKPCSTAATLISRNNLVQNDIKGITANVALSLSSFSSSSPASVDQMRSVITSTLTSFPVFSPADNLKEKSFHRSVTLMPNENSSQPDSKDARSSNILCSSSPKLTSDVNAQRYLDQNYIKMPKSNITSDLPIGNINKTVDKLKLPVSTESKYADSGTNRFQLHKGKEVHHEQTFYSSVEESAVKRKKEVANDENVSSSHLKIDVQQVKGELTHNKMSQLCNAILNGETNSNLSIMKVENSPITSHVASYVITSHVTPNITSYVTSHIASQVTSHVTNATSQATSISHGPENGKMLTNIKRKLPEIGNSSQLASFKDKSEVILPLSSSSTLEKWNKEPVKSVPCVAEAENKIKLEPSDNSCKVETNQSRLAADNGNNIKVSNTSECSADNCQKATELGKQSDNAQLNIKAISETKNESDIFVASSIEKGFTGNLEDIKPKDKDHKSSKEVEIKIEEIELPSIPCAGDENSEKLEIKSDKYEKKSSDELNKAERDSTSPNLQQPNRPLTPKVPPIRIILGGGALNDKEHCRDQPGKHALPYVVTVPSSSSEKISTLPAASISPSPKIPSDNASKTSDQGGEEKLKNKDGDKLELNDDEMMGRELQSERRVTRSAVRAQREKQQQAGKTGTSDNKAGEDQALSEKDTVINVVGEVSEELPVHPRKRKLTRTKLHDENFDAPSTDANSVQSHYVIEKQDNPYKSARDLKRKMTQRHSQLLEATINLKAPDDFKDYLLSSRNYLIRGKPSAALRQTNTPMPPSLAPELQELFTKQEKQRQELQLRHIVEKERVVLAMEMQLLREHARGCLETNPSGTTSLSFCSFMRDQGNMCNNGKLNENVLSSTRSHYSSRDLLRWKKEVHDKFDKIKAEVHGRQLRESEALQASQRLEWECKLLQHRLCDSRTMPHIDNLHVPMINVNENFNIHLK